jgi:hypothetical protein
MWILRRAGFAQAHVLREGTLCRCLKHAALRNNAICCVAKLFKHLWLMGMLGEESMPVCTAPAGPLGPYAGD